MSTTGTVADRSGDFRCPSGIRPTVPAPVGLSWKAFEERQPPRTLGAVMTHRPAIPTALRRHGRAAARPLLSSPRRSSRPPWAPAAVPRSPCLGVAGSVLALVATLALVAALSP